MDTNARIERLRERAQRLRDNVTGQKTKRRRFWFWQKEIDPPPPPSHANPAPTLSEAEIAEFEHKYDIALPREYREFLLRVANGGMGPYSGVYPLNAGCSDIRKPFPLKTSWFCSMDEDDRDYRERNGISDALVYNLPAGADPFDGTLTLADIGCGYTVLLVVTGEQRGAVWEEYTCGDGGIHPKSSSFLDWYEHP